MPTSNRSLRFGVFELRPATQELYKGVIRMRLRPQAFQVLEMLAENSGEVVSRDQLRQRLWPEQPYVDFEHGLNTAVKELRGVLNDSAAEPRFIETLPRIGYRLIVPATLEEGSGRHSALSDSGRVAIATPAAGAAASSSGIGAATAPAATVVASSVPRAESHTAATAPSETPAAAAPKLNLTLWWIAGAVAAAIIAASVYVAWHKSSSAREVSSAPAAPTKQMLAVLPFENLTGDPTQEYFSDGLTEEMIGQLGQLDPQHLGVIGRNSVMRYKTNHEPTDEIGRELGVKYLLEGSVRRDADKVRVSAELVQVGSLASIWSREYDRQVQDVLTLQSEIAREIAGEIHLTLNASAPAATVGSHPQTAAERDAYDLYLRGLYFWNKRGVENIERATDYFQQAAAKDPHSARAYAGLANSYALVSGYAGVPPKDLLKKADDAARRAVELDGNLAEAHVARAVVAQDCDWDWTTAEQEYRRAIDLDANYATAHHWYGEYLGLMGRFDESRAEFERARQLDPLSLIIQADTAVALYYAHDYDGSIRQFRKVLDLDPGFPRTGQMPLAYVQKGMTDEAFAWIKTKQWADTAPWYWATAAYVDAHAGKMDAAHAALNSLIRMNERQQIDPLYLANAYVGVGENDRAITWLEKAEAAHSVSLTSLKVDPIYDPLRSDPRFATILHEMNFPQ
jgi:TolB-like protein/DNA-binding winged helix-turn-helix (wHTH) protein/Tfp pilus assembly protein PilF